MNVISELVISEISHLIWCFLVFYHLHTNIMVRASYTTTLLLFVEYLFLKYNHLFYA